MKIKMTVYAEIIRLLLLFFLALSLSNVSGQSGRNVQKTQPTPTPTPQLAPPKDSNIRSAFVIDKGADKYKLIFPTSYEGTLRLKFADVDQAIYSRRVSFIDQLNKTGLQGYKLISTLNYPISLGELNEVQYEYTWFETTSNIFFAKIGFEKKYMELAKKGYRLVEHFLTSSNCEMKGPVSYNEHGVDTSSQYEVCEYKDLFLLERKKDIEQPIKYILAGSGPGWKAKMGDVLTDQINESLSEGLYPTHAFSKFEILLQQTTDKDEFQADGQEIRVITSANFNWGRNDLEKQANDLGKQGYQLVLANNSIAVMHRNKEMMIPVSYIWLDTKKKDFETQLTTLQKQGAIYCMTYSDKHGTKNKLVFEQRPMDDGKRREYKVLKFEFEDFENTGERRVSTDLTPSSKETLKEMNRLAKEGFTVRDLFFSDKVSVILERVPNN